MTHRGEVTHACPPTGQDITSCCGEHVFDLPHADWVSPRPELVTCSRVPLPAGVCPCGAACQVNWSPLFRQWLCGECLDTRTRVELGEIAPAPKAGPRASSVARGDTPGCDQPEGKVYMQGLIGDMARIVIDNEIMTAFRARERFLNG